MTVLLPLLPGDIRPATSASEVVGAAALTAMVLLGALALLAVFARKHRHAGRPVHHLLGGAALLLIAIGAPGFAWRAVSAAPAVVQGATQGAPSDTIRFNHPRHASLSCTTCHNARDPRGVLRWTVANECMGCHHGDTDIGRDCARCHASSEMAVPRPVATPMALTVWAAPKTRTLAFRHERHGALECSTCHAATPAHAVEKTCASCHADHHAAGRDCASCHESPRATHTRQLHATGCATAGCHVRENTAAVTPVRSTCLACHAEQASHKPGRECATCHLSNWTSSSGGRQ